MKLYTVNIYYIPLHCEGCCTQLHQNPPPKGIWYEISGVSLKWWYPTIHPVKSSELVLDSFSGTSSGKKPSQSIAPSSHHTRYPDAWLNPNGLKWYSSRSISFLLPLSLYVFVWLYMFYSFIYITRYQERCGNLPTLSIKHKKRLEGIKGKSQGLRVWSCLASQAFLPKILKQGQAMGREKRISR